MPAFHNACSALTLLCNAHALRFNRLVSIPGRRGRLLAHAAGKIDYSVLVANARQEHAGPRELGVNNLESHRSTASSFGNLAQPNSWLSEHSSVGFKIHRPSPTDYGIHTTLLSPEIGRFYDKIRDLTTVGLCKNDTAAASKLCVAMCNTYEDGELRSAAARDILCEYFDLPKNSLNHVSHSLMKKLNDGTTGCKLTATRNDGGLEVCLSSLSCNSGAVAMPLSLMCKAEAGFSQGSPFEQNFGFYLDSLLKNNDCLANTRCPALLVSIVGPLIGIQSAAFASEPVLDPAVPLTPLLVTPHDPEAQLSIARFLRAMKNCVEELTQYYMSVKLAVDPEQLAYPYVNYFDVTHNNAAVKVYFRYTRPLQATKLVYCVVVDRLEGISDTELKDFPYFVGGGFVVKFSRTYSTDAHEAAYLHNKGAPKLLAMRDLPGGWKLIAMEQLKGESMNDNNKRVVKEALESLANHLHQCGYVHGDLRSENIQVIPGAGVNGTPRVALLDFGWACPAGETFYPPFMSGNIMWSSGAEDFAPITFDHDRDQIEQIYGRKLFYVR